MRSNRMSIYWIRYWYHAVAVIFLLFDYSFGQDLPVTRGLDKLIDSASIDSTIIWGKENRSSFQISYTSNIKNIDPLERKIDYGKFALFFGSALAVEIAAFTYQGEDWWFKNKGPFNFYRDNWFNNYSLGMDKLGHAFASYSLSYLFSSGYEYSNISTNKAYLYGSITALAHMLYVEINDAYMPRFGFSIDDMAANTFGLTYNYLQYRFPVLKNIQPRYSYRPHADLFKQTRKANFFDDHEYTKYWVSFRMKKLLPEKIAEYWPKYLMLSVGMGIKRNPDLGGILEREVYIGLDFDPLELPIHGAIGSAIKNAFNFIHFPLPGIRIRPSFKIVGMAY